MHDPIAYTYEASEHCPSCAEARFGRDEHGTIAYGVTDSEGNEPGAVFSWEAFEDRDMVCGTCGGIIHEIEREDEPEEGDYIIASCGQLGAGTFVDRCGGYYTIGKVADEEAAETAIRARMEHEQFWPNVWALSDHGNWHLRTLEDSP